MQDIRNIAIIAHVDHGKTTLVDAMLKQTHTFRDNQAEMTQTTIMDSNDLEREKGITILSKNTAVDYENVRINIIDTPGHADFGGEVERVLNMADGALLIVDAAEGPLPQTRFVLQKAFETGLKVILVINKVDKKLADVELATKQVEDLFLQLAKNDEQLSFPIIYAHGKAGKAWDHNPSPEEILQPGDLRPLFNCILTTFPSAKSDDTAPFQMLISTLEKNSYLGTLSIGRVQRGTAKVGDMVALCTPNGKRGTNRIEKLFISHGLEKLPVQEVSSGDIASIAGMKDLQIGDTLTDPATPDALTPITVTEPTMKITIGPNTSPFAGKDGKFVTSRQIRERLYTEVETNLGLKVEDRTDKVGYIVSGRGELHLAVLIETMRREGYELEVSRPQVIYKEINGVMMEPFDEVTVIVPDDFGGIITTEFGKRLGMTREVTPLGNGETKFIFEIAQRNVIGARTGLMTETRGTLQMSSAFIEYRRVGQTFERMRNGVLIASETGTSANFGLDNAQQRGTLFIGAGEPTYMGMIVGLNSRDTDMRVNVNKVKESTNVRSANKDMLIKLITPVRFSLEQCLDFLQDDELLEVTPKALRLRKLWLTTDAEARAKKGLK